jgi:hypothetical protein
MFERSTLEERGGWLFVKDVEYAFDKPLQIVRWWPIGLRFQAFANARFNSIEEARAFLGCRLRLINAQTGLCRDETNRGWEYRLLDGGQTVPERVESFPVPEPMQRGRKLPVHRRDGHWMKETARGWKVA